MQQNEELRAYFDRASKYIPELFNIAHAITGNYDSAEYAVQCALSEAWLKGSRSRKGLRDDLKDAVRQASLKQAEKPVEEMTWEMAEADTDTALARVLFQESTDVRRVAALRYGCDLSYAQIARLTGMTEGNARDVLERFKRRLRRETAGGEEPSIREWVEKIFQKVDRTMPGLNVIYRSFESEMSEHVRVHEKKHHVSRFAAAILTAVIVVICLAGFWLIAVLTQSTQPENYNAAATEEPEE